MNVGIIGSGIVGQTLAAGFLQRGHEVMIGTRTAAKLAAWSAKNPGAKVGSFPETAIFGDLVVLAVKGSIASAAVQEAGIANLDGKVIIDATNPIADEPPTDGVLKFFTTHDESLMEQLQKLVPGARLVKAFSCVGSAFMVDPQLQGGKPTMFICGNDERAKSTVEKILTELGWETADMGTAVAARAIEPLCMLWCIPGFRHNRWNHAFKLLTA